MPLAAALVPALLVAGAVAAIVYVRSARRKGAMAVARGACQACQAQALLVDVHYRQNTGMLVQRRVRSVQGSLCRGCSLRFGRNMTLHNLVLGWWGYISMVVNPLFIIGNLFHLGNTLALPPHDADVAASLDVQREYALNLLATKDEATVVEVLTKLTGAPEAQVRDFVRRLRAAA